MNIHSNLVAKAYASMRPATAPDPAIAQKSLGSGFQSIAKDFVSTLQQGEDTAKAAIVSNADPHTLVQSLAQTKLAVETAVTLRDKVVEAYQEILRMPV